MTPQDRAPSPWLAAWAALLAGALAALLVAGWLIFGESELLGLQGLQALALGAALILGVLALLAAAVAWGWGRAMGLRLQVALDAARALRGACEEDAVARERLAHRDLADAARLALREEELQRREAEWQALHASMAVSITDVQGRLLDVNARFCEISGYRREELLGEPYRLLSAGHHPVAFWARFWQELRAGRAWRGQLCNRSKTGEIFWLDARVAPLFDAQGRVQRYISVASDASPQLRRERELTQEGQRLGAVIEGMQAGTWEWLFQTGGLRVNSRFAALVGLAEHLVGLPLQWTDFGERLHPEDQDRVQVALRRHLSGQAGRFELELRLRTEVGGWHWCQLRGTVVQRTPTGDPLVLAGTLISIDERRRVEERARIQQLISSRTQHLARVGGFELRLADRLLTWTEEAFRLLEMTPGEQPSLDQALAYVHEDDRLALRRAVRQAVSEASGWELELRLRTALGRELWVRVVGEAEYDDSGPVRVVGAIQDIAERRALEEGMHRQQAVLRSVVDNLPLGVSVFGADMKLIARSQSLPELLELPPSLLVEGQSTYEDLVRFNIDRGEYGPGETGQRALQRLMQLARDPVPHHFERTRPNGITLDVRGAPMPDGGLVTTYIDISERKRAEEAMRAQERFLRLVADAVPGRIAYWSRGGRCVFANRAFAAGLRTTPERIVGLTAEELQGGRWIDELPQQIAPALAEGRALRYELPEDAGDDNLLVHVEPDVAEDGSVRGVVVMALDVSELKAVQRQTDQLNRLLSVERDRANAASVAKSQFLATMSHEIRTPLNAVLGLLRLLRHTPLLGQQLDYVSKTEGAAKSLLGLLNDILDFSKVEAGRLELEQRPFTLDEVLRPLSDIMAATAGGKALELVFDLDPALPTAFVGDPLRLQQVLINLTGNAIKFTADGEVVLHARLLQPLDGRARIGIAVQDTGIGIAADKLATIFEGFTQAEASTTRRYGGTGLGLAISQRLVQAMGGELHVGSEPGRGSVFSFDVELRLPDAEPIQSPAQPPSCRQLLLVEPHEASRAALRSVLEGLGVTVHAVGRGDEARALLAQWPDIDGAWVAARLPDEDGGDCAQALLAQQRARGRPLRWWMTGGALLREQLSNPLRAPEGPEGPDGFVVKPVCASMALDALAGAVGPAAPVAHERPLQGLHLLVVEDNPTNQQVAQALLQHAGARITLADDGEQALALLREQRFDAVLMDMQMPVMDGLSATRAIRGELGLGELPIVAMTANAMAADREACLQAGMNEHVGKPFDLDRLVPLLLGLTRHQAPSTRLPRGAAAVMPTRSVPAEAQQRAAAQGLDLQAGMDRFLGRTELYLRTATSFASQARELPAKLRAQMAATPPDLEAAQHALHSFKGLAATLACERLAHWGRAGEQRARAGQALEAAWIDSFEIQLSDGLQRLLSEARELHEPQPETPPPPTSQPALLARLQSLLDDENAEVLAFVAGQRDALGAWLGDDLERLDETLASLDFPAARRVLAERFQPA